LVASIARGRRWLDETVTGAVSSIEQIVARENCSVRQVNMTISLAFLAPNLVQAAVQCRGGLASRVCAMLRQSGRASMRCSGCRVDRGRFHSSTWTGAGNGFAEPRDSKPKSTLSRPQRAAEIACPVSEPAKMPQLRAFRQRPGDGVSYRIAW